MVREWSPMLPAEMIDTWRTDWSVSLCGCRGRMLIPWDEASDFSRRWIGLLDRGFAPCGLETDRCYQLCLAGG
jgi:hypothetical protein